LLGATREFIEAIIIAVVVFFILQVSVQNFKVEGSSMDPTLEDGEYLLVNKLVYLHVDIQRLANLVPFWNVEEERKLFPFHSPNVGEVIVFHYPLDPERDFVKRIIAGPGQTVEIRHGNVYVDGVELEESYAVGSISGEYVAPQTMGPEEYFVVGDNRPFSSDSRDWGPVPFENIVGRVWATYWPLSHIGFLGSSAPQEAPTAAK
jgi:signal peptidase I